MSMSWSLCLVALVCMVVDASTLRPSQKLQYSIHKSTKLFRPVRTLLIDNFDSYTYNIWQLLAEINGIEPYVVHNNAFGGDWDVLMSQIPLFDNIVLSPGPGSPDREEDFGLCLDAICRSTVPLLGICLGHQGLAHAYGGRVSKARTPMHGRISRISSVRNSELFSNIEQDAEVVRYHSLIVDKLPADLRATAWTSLSSASNMDDDNDPIIMALEHVSRPQYGVQFHPESVRTPLGRQLLSNFRDITKRHRKDDNYGRSIDESMMNNSYEGSSSSQRPVTVTHYSSPTIKYEEYLLTGHTAGYGRGHGLKQEEDRSSIKSNVRYVHVTSIPLDASNDVTTEEVFEALYSNCSAAFWLDSQSPLRSSFTLQATASSSGSDGDENHPHSNTSRLSYMGALDTDYSSAVEYHNHHQLLQRHVGADGIHGHSSVLNTSIFQFLRDKFNEESETDTQIDRFMRRSFINNHVTSINNHVPSTQSKLPFEITGAFFGYLGYEVGHEAINILTGTSSSSHPSAGCYDPSTPSHSSAVFGRDMNADEDSSTPLALLLYPSRYIVYDHESSTYHTVSFVESSSRGGNSSRNNSNDNNNNNNNNTFLQEEATRLGEELADRLEAIIGLKRTSCEELKGRSTKATDAAVAVAEQSSRLVAWKSKAAYKNDIATCLENIASGETYEVCLTLQFTGPLRQLHTTDRSTRSRYIDTYKDLRKYNPAPYACFIQYKSPRIRVGASDDHRSVAMPVDANSFAICCTSPECFLKLTPDRVITSRPIKGTTRRNLMNSTDDQLRALHLAADAKAQAENLMIVDLVRNDLGRVCEVGSVHVPKLMHVETYASVHQMVSTITGKLQKDRDLVDALIATFPGGSMTGAPKLRTMELISALEGHPRGVYSGTIGYIGMNGAADLNIVIRTALIVNDTITIGAGGAIVALSNADEEVDEVLLKANSVSNALGYQVEFPADSRSPLNSA